MSATLKRPHLHSASHSLIAGSASKTILISILNHLGEHHQWKWVDRFTEGDFDWNATKAISCYRVPLSPRVFENNYDWEVDSFWTIKRIWLKTLCIDSGLPCEVSQSHKNCLCERCCKSHFKSLATASCFETGEWIITTSMLPMWGKALSRTNHFRYIWYINCGH